VYLLNYLKKESEYNFQGKTMMSHVKDLLETQKKWNRRESMMVEIMSKPGWKPAPPPPPPTMWERIRARFRWISRFRIVNKDDICDCEE